MAHWNQLPDLAAQRLGGRVLFANDEFFAEKENLLKAEAAVWIADKYTDRGKWMDGWETRRRRTPGHDFCIIRLGLGGAIEGVDVDTSHFKGNFPEACSIEACESAADKLDDAAWREILPQSPLAGDTHNHFPIHEARRVTHLRFHIYPDGGVARLRVHGRVVPPARPSGTVDLAGLENGGCVLHSSDAFFGSHQNLIYPGKSSGMHDGWETRRKRRGHDFCIIQLGLRGTIAKVEIDTSHFKGNYPDRAAIDVLDAAGAQLADLLDERCAWRPLLGETKLAADSIEKLDVAATPATHARLRIFPDGGVARLRLYGTPLENRETLDRLDEAQLIAVCGSRKWAERVARSHPFANAQALFRAAEQAFDALGRDDWLEAFRAHPRLGDRTALRDKASEQAGAATAPEATLEALAKANRDYEARYGHIFILCASGRGADEMLASVRARIANDADTELAIAAGEQRKITRLRLEKLLSS
jgi:allantoicase